jgi:hypothetical protein
MKLWVYGCSFSEPFGLSLGGAEWDQRGSRILTADYWGTHLARLLGAECMTRSISGVGWNYINDRIDEDILTWARDDVIIISPSFFYRVTFEELVKRDSQSLLAAQMHDWAVISAHNENRWRQKIKTLQHFSYQVYTWLVDDVTHSAIPHNLITAPGLHVNWKAWMDLNYQYWTSRPGVVYPLGDWHFNPQGHLAVANRMYEVICQQQ